MNLRNITEPYKSHHSACRDGARECPPSGLGSGGSEACYLVTMVTIQRVQTGLRMERNTLKVLKGLAEYLDLSLGDLVEGIVLHAFEGKAPFGPPVITKIDQLKAVYGLTLTAADAHKLQEEP